MLAAMFRKKNPAFVSALIFLTSVAAWAQQAATSPVAIVVKDPTGTTVPHALIRIIPSPDPAAKTATDDAGRITTSLRPGGYGVFVRSAGFKSSATHIEVQAAKELQVFTVMLELGATGSPLVSSFSAKDGLFFVAHPYHDDMGFSFAALKAMPRTTVTVHNSHTSADESYVGVRLFDLLTFMGAPVGKELHGGSLANYLVATGSDGYEVVLAIAEVDPDFHPGEVVVADTLNGKPLDEASGPLKLVVTEDKRPARSVRNLTTIELKAAR
jgi:hypothetical protein